ncbi:MAG: DUF5995 family protein [Bacteroidota bacterium]
MERAAPFSPAQTIQEVIDRLETIIQWCEEHNSRLGYFPVLYQSVTKAVQQGIVRGRFEDGPRMERLDVIFANRYLEAWHLHRQGERPTEVWQIAFQQGEKRKMTVLHHLFLGINAHINLDLGISAAATSPGDQLPDLEGDFREINRLLAEMVDGVQTKLGELSSIMRWLDRAVGRLDERMAELSLKVARKNAWRVAKRFAAGTSEQYPQLLQEEDQRAAIGGRLLSQPGWKGRLFIWLLQLGEKRLSPHQVIDMLHESTHATMRGFEFAPPRD